ncbi:transcriptional repressor [Microlunatus endophyticus]|uniref:Transcriptional repressor n=1 Tax=Microlunatus endophyticus TaxID=1716077 RepID=A0A917RZW8_9ACTN|nr:Fur family transcriptional regulator [Microlunatus endophyticus]GGL47742.1 transcriptional repressor [Microlunatus endophyticus]
MGTMTSTIAAAATGPDWRERLRSAGLRVTQPRLAVLETVRESSHLAADQVCDRVRERIGTVSTQAVYDALNTLTDHQILRRIEPAGSAMLFEINAGDNHHHIVCRQCGAVADVDCAVGTMPCAVPQQTHGFVVEEAEVTYWGLCPDCASDPQRRSVEAT